MYLLYGRRKKMRGLVFPVRGKSEGTVHLLFHCRPVVFRGRKEKV
jgi:hypothetical protein